jgi:integrase
MSRITTTAVRTRGTASSRWLTDGGSRGTGRLAARIKPSGVSLYFQYFHGSQRRWLPLGPYDESGERGLSLIQARDRTADLSALYRSGVHDLHSHIERQLKTEADAQKAAEIAAANAAQDAKRGTLKQLLSAYVTHLEQAGKMSAKDVRSIFDKHVFKASAELGGRKASELSIDDFVGMIGRLVESGKGRTADKLRSYLRSAYQLALESKTNPAAPLTLRTYGIQINPIASIGALSQFNRTRERVLSSDELGALLRRVDGLDPGPQKDVLQLLLLLGGQRPVQLLRLKATDVDLTACTATLYDPKGARQQPRAHVLPLVAEAKAILSRRLDGLALGEPVFSTDGEHFVRVETLGAQISSIVTKMLECDPPEARESFQLRDIRRTCETQMAGLKFSRDVRAQLQSHGLGGVQTRHYDRHSYFAEKKQALQKWAKHLRRLQAIQPSTAVSTAISVPTEGTKRRQRRSASE